VKTLAITGATGFVGQHLVEMAVAAGFEVRALTRSAQRPLPGVTWIEGALDRPDSLSELVRGADAVVHVAGLITGGPEALEAVNVGGTAAMVEAAKDRGVRRFLHISSLAAREPGLSDYGRSKRLSEQMVTASGLDWTIVRPPAVYGPGDRETLELFKMAKKGIVMLPPKGHFSVIHVEDLCRLFLAILAKPESVFELYEPDDDRCGGWEHREFGRALGRALDRRALPLSIPRAVMQGTSVVERLFRRERAKLTADRVRYFCHPDWVVAPAKRPPEWLWTPKVPTPAGLKETADWYQSEGWL
jgi:uncharacterized protein YbjT (DUF2867 family)